MIFGSFFDEEKTEAENKKESDKAKHNREVIMGVTAVFACVSAVVGAGFAIKKVMDEFV